MKYLIIKYVKKTIEVSLLLLNLCFSLSAKNKKEDLCSVWRYQMDTTNNLVFAMERSREFYNMVEKECQAKIDILIGEVHMINHQPDSAHFYTNQGIFTAKKIESNDALSLGFNKKASLYIEEEKLDSAKIFLAKSRIILVNNISSQRWAGYFDCMGNIADMEGNYDLAISYLDSTINSGYIKDSLSLAITYHNRGVYQMRLSDFESSAESFIKAYTINSQIKGGDIAANCLMIGFCYNSWKRYEPARNYLEAGIEAAIKNNNYDVLIKLYNNLATNQRLSGKDDQALKTVNKVLKILENRKDNFEAAKANLEKARILSSINPDSKEALIHTQLAYNQSLNSVPLSQIAPALDLAKYKIRSKEFVQAKQYLDKIKELLTILNRANYEADYNLILSEYYEGTRQFESALRTRRIYQHLTDSIANNEVMYQVAALERKFNTQQNELDISRLNEENAIQYVKISKARVSRNFYLLMSVLLAGFMIAGLFVYQKLKSQKKSLDKALKKLKEVDQVKNKLFSIISHDLRSMIFPFRRVSKVLNHHVEKGNIEKTLLLARDLEKNANNISVVLDNMLEWSLNQMEGYSINEENINLTQEFNSIFSVFEQHAQEKNIHLEVNSNFQQDIMFDKGAFHIIFRNLIANAIKFTENGLVSVNYEVEKEFLIIDVKDSGVGMASEIANKLFDSSQSASLLGTQGEKGTGLGLNLVKQFVEKLKGQIIVQSKIDQGTLFTLKFPYQLTNS